MDRHDTPLEVARVLFRHSPKVIKRLLDPCVGSGALVKPFLVSTKTLSISCVDIDPKVKKELAVSSRKDKRIQVVQADFLRWANKPTLIGEFDCVVMNPPFAARPQHQVQLRRNTSGGNQRTGSVPTEMAFLFKSMSLLITGGKLLAVVPASVIASASGTWLREHMMRSGAIRIVHELTPRTFSGVEGRMYLLVYESGATQTTVTLRNHRLRNPDELKIRPATSDGGLRLDFAFHESQGWLRTLRRIEGLRWQKTSDLATVWRGQVKSPVKSPSILHTTNLKSLVPKRRYKIGTNPVKMGDIVCKRVARSCAESFIMYQHTLPVSASDCLLVFRPNRNVNRYALLFAIRVLVASRRGAALVEKGLSATYLTIDELSALQIPISLADRFPDEFRRFKTAVKRRMWKELPFP